MNLSISGLPQALRFSALPMEPPLQQAGGRDEFDNGNGSLMRILPVVLRFAAEPIELFADRVESVSSITHGHSRSRMACVFYGLVVRQAFAWAATSCGS